MSDFFHGAKASKQATSVSTPVTADSSIHLIVGTAPAHMVGGKVNEPVYASTYTEAVEAMGYSEDWGKYDICEEIYSSFKLYQNGPVVMINVLDPKKHLAGETTVEKTLAGGTLDLPLEALADTVVVKGYGSGETLTEEYTKGTDYDLLYTDGVLRLERIAGGKITTDTAKLNIKYNAVDPTKVKKSDIIGGYDVSSKKSSGFELVDSVFPKFRVIPTLFLAPNFSSDSEVAAVMAAKAENINGLFTGKALIDVDTSVATTYTEAVEWKNKNNITQPSQLLMWPMYTLGGKTYHASVHQAGLMAKTDATEDLGKGTPCESASNKSLQIDGMVLADGTEVLLDLTKANYLNANGIITALNFIGGFVSWGNETACYPANTDVTDYFYNVSRMFSWVGNSVILSVWSKVDRRLNKRLIESVVDSLNIWLNGLMADEIILGGRIEFLEEENTETDLMAGKAKFHIYLTPPSPAKELDFVLEYERLAQSQEKIKEITEKQNKNSEAISKTKGQIAGTIGTVTALAGSFFALDAATEEYRNNQAKLTTAFQSAGLSTEAATQAYQGFYKILGDDDWDSVLLLAIVVALIIYLIKTGQTKILKQIAVKFVTDAEGECGTGTGVIKLSEVVAKLYNCLPSVVRILFTEKQLVDIAESVLAEAKKKWEANENLAVYIENKQQAVVLPAISVIDTGEAVTEETE